jgi:D-alanine-D-alanine ligase
MTRDELKQKKIGILKGGLSEERDVSLRSGAAVAAGLVELGYAPIEIDVGRDLPAQLVAAKIDCAFIALHGRYGEDGCVQGLLESMFIPYTGSGVLASSVGMDKVFTKQVFVAHGLATPAWASFDTPAAALAAKLPFDFPCVVKPSREGSSVGIHICKSRSEYEAAIADACRYAGKLLVEQYVKGREVQGAVLDDEALGAIEIVPAREFYDYQAKYGANSGTKYLFPAPVSAELYEKINQTCLAAHRALGCAGSSRSDVIVTPDGQTLLLETNTLPGMTATSLLPKIAAGRGIGFPQLCERLLLGASLKA